VGNGALRMPKRKERKEKYTTHKYTRTRKNVTQAKY